MIRDPRNATIQTEGPDVYNGSEYDDFSFLDGGNDTMFGNGGNDFLMASSGDDLMRGGIGDDQLWGGAGSDTVYGDAGNDYVASEYSNYYNQSDDAGVRNALYGGTGNDTMLGGFGDDSVYGEADDDSIDDVWGNDTLDGGAGNDTIRGGYGADVIRGGDGSDNIYASQNDTIDGGLGDDAISLVNGAGAAVFGGDGADLFQLVDGAGSVFGQNEYTPSVDSIVRVMDFDVAEGDRIGVVGTSYSYGALPALWRGQADAGFTATIGQDVSLTGSTGQPDGFAELWTFYNAATNRSVLFSDTNRNGIVDGTDLRIEFLGVASIDEDAFEAGSFDGIGTDGNDTLTGAAEVDSLYGMDGNDSLSGLGGNDALQGGAGDDSLNGGADDDVLSGGLGADTLLGGAGADQLYAESTASNYYGETGLRNWLYGGAGDDQLNGGEGIDYIDGGADRDYIYAGHGDDRVLHDATDYTVDGDAGYDTLLLTTAVTVNLDNYSDQTTGDTAWVQDFEHVDASAVLTSVNMTGNWDSNRFIGGQAADTLSGGDGNDTLDGRAGADRLVGGNGDDTFIVDGADVVVEALDGGIDTIESDAASVVLGANLENLRLTANGNATGTGNAGNNILIGNAFDNVLNGGAGVDLASYETATSAVNVTLALATAQATGAGADTLLNMEGLIGGAYGDQLTGNALANTLIGGGGNDVLRGAAGNDSLRGDAGSDTLEGGLGDDSMIGGDGIDTASFASATAGVDVSMDSYGGYDTTGQGLDYFEGIENLLGSAFNDSLTGNSSVSNRLDGGAGNDTLNGTYAGYGAIDTLVGGAGDDTYNMRSATDVIVEAAGGGIDTVVSSLSDITVGANVEIIRFANEYYQANATGNALDNTFFASYAGNILNGAGGNDTVSYANGGVVRVSLAVTGSQDTYSSGYDTLISIENLIGSNYNDTLTGNGVANLLDGGTGADTLSGNGGNDTLRAGAGDDRLDGSFGDDLLDGSIGIDTVSYETAAAGISVNLALAGAQATGGGGNDTLLSIENVFGSVFADTIRGNGQANTLEGYNGADTLSGGGGADVLTGGVGADHFQYTALGESTWAVRDTITDFNRFQGDKLDLSLLDANTALDGDQGFTFIGSAAFSADATGQLRYEGGVVYGSVDADAAAEFVVTLAGAPPLLAADFLL